MYGHLVADHNPHLAQLFSESPTAFVTALRQEVGDALRLLSMLTDADAHHATELVA